MVRVADVAPLPEEARLLGHIEMIARITTGAALGTVIGYERARHGRPVGLRTHMIVAMASATFMVVSSQFVYYQDYRANELVEVDTSRIAASVVSAVGFIAGGAILRSGVRIQGLTTAAGLWLVTAVGLCTGSGMYVEGVFATGLGLLALAFLRRFEDKDDQRIGRRVTVVSANREDVVSLVQAMRSSGAVLAELTYEKHDAEPRIVFKFDLKQDVRVGLEMLLLELEQRPGVRSVKVR
jgi:putative Mg2+ transporter-C (MgtC) family protein